MTAPLTQNGRAEEASPNVRILREPLTYEARLVRDRHQTTGFRAIANNQNHSYVRDFCLAEMRGDLKARERLDRHAKEMRVISEERKHVFHPDVEYDFEQRAVNWSSGTGGYFAPPLWIIEQYAVQPTPHRVLSRMAPQFELPEGAQSVNLPAWSQGAEVGANQVGAPVASQDTVDTPLSSAVVTIAGNYDVPMQMLEQSPQGAHLDWVAFSTMEARYGYQLEQQLFIGQGATTPQGSGNNQLLGIFNNTAIPAANLIQFTNGGVTAEASPGTPASAAQGATSMFGFLGLAIAKVGQARRLPPETWMMTTSRAAWLGSSEDLQNRPLMIADGDGSGKWDLISIEVELNDAIPRNSGATVNEERIVVCRPSDWIILESDRRTSVNSLKDVTGSGARTRDVARGDAMSEVLSGTLMARLQMRRYAAAILRYPSSVAYLLGTGMATGGGW